MKGAAAPSHKTAVVLIPPEEIWEPIQALRRQYDRHVARWMPHVTLLYPFRPMTEFAAALPALEAACRTCAPFELELAQFRFFAHGARGFTMWLAPEPRAELVRLHAALVAAAPECDATARGPQGFTPHPQYPVPQLRWHSSPARAPWLRCAHSAIGSTDRLNRAPCQDARAGLSVLTVIAEQGT